MSHPKPHLVRAIRFARLLRVRQEQMGQVTAAAHAQSLQPAHRDGGLPPQFLSQFTLKGPAIIQRIKKGAGYEAKVDSLESEQILEQIEKGDGISCSPSN